MISAKNKYFDENKGVWTINSVVKFYYKHFLYDNNIIRFKSFDEIVRKKRN